jgi:hypothetical protein
VAKGHAGMSERNIREEDQKRFRKTNYIFLGELLNVLVKALLNVLVDHLVDALLHIIDAKALWDHLNATYGVSGV